MSTLCGSIARWEELAPAVSSSLPAEAIFFCPALHLWKGTKRSCGIVAPAQVLIPFKPMKPLLDSKAWTSVTLDLLSSLWKERKELGATKRGNRKEREEENGEKQGGKEDKGMKLEREAGSVRGERG